LAGIRKAEKALAAAIESGEWEHAPEARVFVSPNTCAAIRKGEHKANLTPSKIYPYVKPEFQPKGITADYLAACRANPGRTAHAYMHMTRGKRRARNDFAYRAMRCLKRHGLVRSEVRGRTTVYYPAE
jgi:hypothetical protein